MRKILMIAAIVVTLLTTGCVKTQSVATESQFDTDLRGLYSKIQSFGSQTRAWNGEVELTEEQWAEIFEDFNSVAQSNGILQEMEQAELYIDLRNGEMPFDENWDVYDYLNWLEQNTTPEFMELVFELLSGETVTLDDAINSKFIRNDEKLALVGAIALTPLITIGAPVTPEAGACYAAYDAALKKCSQDAYAWGVAAFIAGCIHPVFGLIVTGAGLYGNDACTKRAREARDKCLGY